MGEQTREKEAETWADFIREFLNEGGVIYGSQEKQKREVVYDKSEKIIFLDTQNFNIFGINFNSRCGGYIIWGCK